MFVQYHLSAFFVFGLLYVNVRGISFIICVHAPSPPISRGLSLVIAERNHRRKRVVIPVHFLQRIVNNSLIFVKGFLVVSTYPAKLMLHPEPKTLTKVPLPTGSQGLKTQTTWYQALPMCLAAFTVGPSRFCWHIYRHFWLN